MVDNYSLIIILFAILDDFFMRLNYISEDISLLCGGFSDVFIDDSVSTVDEINSHYKYIFEGEGGYWPFMSINKIDNEFNINNIKISTFKHNHGPIDVQTYRINNFAYTTDLKKFYNNDIDKLKNLDLWVVGLLRYDSHHSHASFDEIIEYVNYLKPKTTIFTHMTALIDENEILKLCPTNVFPGYDGMEIVI